MNVTEALNQLIELDEFKYNSRLLYALKKIYKEIEELKEGSNVSVNVECKSCLVLKNSLEALLERVEKCEAKECVIKECERCNMLSDKLDKFYYIYKTEHDKIVEQIRNLEFKEVFHVSPRSQKVEDTGGVKKVDSEKTKPVTEHVTEPVTEHVTEPATEAATEAVTEPVTEAATEPVTEAATEAVTEPVTKAVENIDKKENEKFFRDPIDIYIKETVHINEEKEKEQSTTEHIEKHTYGYCGRSQTITERDQRISEPTENKDIKEKTSECKRETQCDERFNTSCDGTEALEKDSSIDDLDEEIANEFVNEANTRDYEHESLIIGNWTFEDDPSARCAKCKLVREAYILSQKKKGVKYSNNYFKQHCTECIRERFNSYKKNKEIVKINLLNRKMRARKDFEKEKLDKIREIESDSSKLKKELLSEGEKIFNINMILK